MCKSFVLPESKQNIKDNNYICMGLYANNMWMRKNKYIKFIN